MGGKEGTVGYNMAKTLTFTSLHSQNDSGDLRGVAGGDGSKLVVRQAPVVCVMAPPIHQGAWSMAMAAF